MKNKTLTLILSVLTFSTLISACNKPTNNIETAKVYSTEIKEKIKEADVSDINFDDLDKSISKSVLATNERLPKGELNTEGHIFIGSELDGNTLTAYVIAGISNFSFINNELTCIAKEEPLATVITYEINPENNRYTEINYLQGQGFTFKETVNKLFPNQYQDIALESISYFDEIDLMQKDQAQKYLDSLERNSLINVSNKPQELKTEISKETFEQLAPLFPYWEGSLEILENDARFIYITRAIDSKTIECIKKDSNENILLNFIIKNDGSIKNLLENNENKAFEKAN